MAKQLFEAVDNNQLKLLIKRELRNIRINSIMYDSRSHNTEYAQVYFKYKGVDIDEPFVEIIDNNEFAFDTENGSLSFDFVGNQDHIGFVIFTAIVLRAQHCIDRRGLIVPGSLTSQYVSAKCDDMNYILDKTTAREPWDLYTKQGQLIRGYPSLAAVNTLLELELIGVSEQEQEQEDEEGEEVEEEENVY